MFEALTAQLGGLQGPLTALLQVLMIDLVLAGDNAVAVGLAAGGLPPKDRKKVILYGLAAAVVLLISFALITTWLLGVIGLLLAGGLLLLWVCWKMWRELREQAAHADAMAAIDNDPNTEPQIRQPKSFKAAFLQVLIADVSMSLDNVLAVAG
ncbi:MAG TPA: YjbE family putative metal transport protein, partial [Caulobacter sp.]|nr:YjbE family putative metal transport protein [Caulobacter sp.]